MQGFPAVTLALLLAPTVAMAQTSDPNDFVLTLPTALAPCMEGIGEGAAQWPPLLGLPEQSSKDAKAAADREEARLRTYLQLKLLTDRQVNVGIPLALASGNSCEDTSRNLAFAVARDRAQRCEAISAMVPF